MVRAVEWASAYERLDGPSSAKSSPSSPPPNSLESGHSDLPKLVDTQ